jgi:hypothetical protein
MNTLLPSARGRWRCAALGIALSVAVWLNPGGPPAASAQGDGGAKPPPELVWVPADATAVLHMRIAELSKNPVTGRLRAPLGHPWQFLRKDLPKQFALTAEELESVTWVLTEAAPVFDILIPGGPIEVNPEVKPDFEKQDGPKITPPKKPAEKQPEPTPIPQLETQDFLRFDTIGARLMILTTTGKEPADRLLKLLDTMPAAKRDNPILWFRAGERTVVIGQEKEVRQLQKAGPAKQYPAGLAPALRLVQEKYQLVIGLNGSAAVSRGWLEGGIGGGRMFRQLRAANAMALGIRFDRESRLTGQFSYPKQVPADTADAVEDVVIFLRLGVLGELAGRLDQQADQAEGKDQKGELEALTALLLVERMQQGLRQVKIKQQGQAVTFDAAAKTDVAELAQLAVAEAKARRDDPMRQAEMLRARTSNKLKQIGNALHDYHGTYKTFPPPASVANGKPLLSWRVRILPYLNEDDLFNKFKLDEPWDSPHNLKLLPLMPKVFAPAAGQTKEPHETFFQAIVGPGACWEHDKFGKGIRLVDIRDGTSNTVLVAEARKSVPWTKPDDIPFDAGELRPRFGGHTPGGFHALFADCSVRFLRNPNEMILRALITRSGGEAVSIPD